MWPRGGFLADSVPVAERAEGVCMGGGASTEEHRKVEA